MQLLEKRVDIWGQQYTEILWPQTSGIVIATLDLQSQHWCTSTLHCLHLLELCCKDYTLCVWQQFVCDYVLQVFGYCRIMCSIPTTVLWTSRILVMIVLLWSAQLPTQPAVYPLMDLSGTFLMEVRSNVMVLHTTEPRLILILVLGLYVSTVTLGLPQQESFTVTYLMTVETYRVSMWGYIMPPQVSPVQQVKSLRGCVLLG